MSFSIVNSFLAPMGAIMIGIIMKLSNDIEKYGVFKKYWLLFILSGVFCYPLGFTNFYLVNKIRISLLIIMGLLVKGV